MVWSLLACSLLLRLLLLSVETTDSVSVIIGSTDCYLVAEDEKLPCCKESLGIASYALLNMFHCFAGSESHR
ncbi:hypothetical protein QQG55_8600 [Brugia pahangi]